MTANHADAANVGEQRLGLRMKQSEREENETAGPPGKVRGV
jgi:hypothetical protein